jgi:hydrogenase expression/formation protein HypC
MCLALPMRVISVDGAIATIAAAGLEQRASLMLVPEAGVGDYVLVHAGFAISVLGEDEAAETLALLAELAAAGEEATCDAAADDAAASDADGA